MPIQDRKFFIQKHNLEMQKDIDAIDNAKNNSDGDRVLSGESINAFAALEQKKK